MTTTNHNPNWWTPVTFDWNGEPFSVDLAPELDVFVHGDAVFDEDAVAYIREKAQTVPWDRILTLIGREKTIRIQLHCLIQDPFIPERLQTGTTDFCKARDDGALIIYGEKYDIEYAVSETKSDLKSKIAARQIESHPGYFAKGSAFAISDDFFSVVSLHSDQVYEIDNAKMAKAIKWFALNAQGRENAQTLDACLAGIRALISNELPDTPVPNYHQVSHFFRHTEAGRKVFHPVYELLIKKTRERPPRYYVDLD